MSEVMIVCVDTRKNPCRYCRRVSSLRGTFKSLPYTLEQQSMLWRDKLSFAGRDVEKVGVEQSYIIWLISQRDLRATNNGDRFNHGVTSAGEPFDLAPAVALLRALRVPW